MSFDRIKFANQLASMPEQRVYLPSKWVLIYTEDDGHTYYVYIVAGCVCYRMHIAITVDAPSKRAARHSNAVSPFCAKRVFSPLDKNGANAAFKHNIMCTRAQSVCDSNVEARCDVIRVQHNQPHRRRRRDDDEGDTQTIREIYASIHLELVVWVRAHIPRIDTNRVHTHIWIWYIAGGLWVARREPRKRW